jgi:lipid-A-disaccharide synthase-like uncharacterized protein
VTDDQLWGAAFLALGAFEAWRIYRSVDSGKWIISYVAKVSIGRSAHPMSFWVGVALDVLMMVFLLFLGTYDVAPSILSVR